MSLEHVFTALFPFGGLGAGARGFLQAVARLGPDAARFRNLGGIDVDAEACADFETLTGAPSLCADMSKLTPAELLAFAGHRRPDVVFLSPPCKGFSGLLSKKSAEAPKYRALNQLVFQGVFLMMETWAERPPLLVIENVPRIATRGAELLRKVRQLLSGYGYVFHASAHDCGELGGLAQHRRRFLLVARLPSAVPAYVYQPPKKRVRGCGEVLGELPLPETPEAGDMHRLPKLSWLNWVRLALIPAGGDWRDLPRDGQVGLAATADGADTYAGRPGLFGVNDWRLPVPTVTGSATVSSSNTAAAVADPRVPLEHEPRRGSYGVTPWEQPAATVRGVARASNGGAAVADPRVPRRNGSLGVRAWDAPANTVTGESYPSNGSSSVADPRLPAHLLTPLAPGQKKRELWARHDVRAWDQPARTVAGSGSNGGVAVADPRVAGTVALTANRDSRFTNQYRVRDWAEPAGTVTGDTDVQEGAQLVADPRAAVALGCRPRAGVYGVLSWEEAASTVTGNARVDNGAFAVADPRSPPDFVPVIVAVDGTWHRPITTLELAALQGIPTVLNGKPLALAGRSVARWRERIGNAVPVQAGEAIAGPLLKALLAASLGTWFLSPTGEPIWVRQDGAREDVLEAEMGEVAA